MVDITKARMLDNIAHIKVKLAEAAKRSGRSAEDVALIGVTKFQPLELLYMALDCGIEIFGENRVQERETKKAGWDRPDSPSWQMIGHLQKNKARKAVALFDCIQSIDSRELAATIDRIVAEENRTDFPVMIEVNTSGEESKNGVTPQLTEALAEYIITDCPNLQLGGLMTIGPLTGDESAVRGSFAHLRELRGHIRDKLNLPLPELSMGMTGDYLWAVEEGSTMVRIGTGIFGARLPH